MHIGAVPTLKIAKSSSKNSFTATIHTSLTDNTSLLSAPEAGGVQAANSKQQVDDATRNTHRVTAMQALVYSPSVRFTQEHTCAALRQIAQQCGTPPTHPGRCCIDQERSITRVLTCPYASGFASKRALIHFSACFMTLHCTAALSKSEGSPL